MKSGKAFLLFLFLLGSSSGKAQTTDIFVSIQTGSPFRVLLGDDNGAPVIWNYCFGVEEYLIDKLSIALSYRKSFYVAGKDESVQWKQFYDSPDDYEYTYREDYNMYSIDFESKYFFEEPDDDGLYMSSGISFQHITLNLDVIGIPPNTTPVPVPNMIDGSYKDEINIYPLSIKLGHRYSGDVMVFDYFTGLTYFSGTGSVRRTYEQNLDLYEFKSVAYIIGMKLGFKF